MLASLVVRFAARKHLHHSQRDGRNVRKVIVVGSAYAAADLVSVLRRETAVRDAGDRGLRAAGRR